MKTWQWLGLSLVLLLSIIGEFAGGHHEAHHWWSGIPMFFVLFGAVGAVLLIVFCKFFLFHLIAKREDYYDNAE